VTPRLEGHRCGGRPPPRARGHPPVEHFDLRGATARQIQALRFVEVSRWFPRQWDPRALEGFYTPLHEDFYRAYVDSGITFRPQRVCRLEALVEVVGEQLRPHLFFLPSLSDLLGWTRAYTGLGSESFTLHFGLTQHMSLYTLHSEAVTADCTAPEYGRSLDSQLQRRRYTSCALARLHL
jgi:hypothetical protein